MNLNYLFNSGKNPKWLYFMKSYLRLSVPNGFWQLIRKRRILEAKKRADWPYMQQRIDYYCRLNAEATLPANATTISQACRQGKKVYRLDASRYTRWFKQHLKMLYIPGDVTEVPEFPAFVKSRPIATDGISNRNAVLLKLNAVRHFIFVHDSIPFAKKKNVAVFRGKVKGKPMRQRFFQEMFGKPFCDLGDTSSHTSDPKEWQRGKMTIGEHLKYKFVLALEGNDVASNLKWVMSSNSIAVTPHMKYETWFMEGKLIPDYHYIEIKDDFSDLEEKIQYYSTHIEEAQAIIDHAHEFVRQFRNHHREELLGQMVCEKYFEMTGQEKD